MFCLPASGATILSQTVHIPGQVDFPPGCGRRTELLPSASAGVSDPPLSVRVPPPGPASADSRAPNTNSSSSSSSKKGSASGSQSEGRAGRQDKQQRRLALQKTSSRIKQAAEDPTPFPLQPPPPLHPAAAAIQSPLPSPSPSRLPAVRQVPAVRHPPLLLPQQLLLDSASDPFSGLLLSPQAGTGSSALGATLPRPGLEDSHRADGCWPLQDSDRTGDGDSSNSAACRPCASPLPPASVVHVY